MGLANPICARNVGLDKALAEPMLIDRLSASEEPLKEETTGEDAPELIPLGMVMGIGIGTRGLLGVRGKKAD